MWPELMKMECFTVNNIKYPVYCSFTYAWLTIYRYDAEHDQHCKAVLKDGFIGRGYWKGYQYIL